MSKSGGQLHGCALTVVMLVLLQASAAMAESTEERLQRLEGEIKELRQLLQKQTQSAPAAAARPVRPVPEEAPPVRHGALVHYYISSEPLGKHPPDERVPTVEGRVPDPHMLSFNPADYDVPDAGWFSNYHDPASYRYIGLVLEADFPVREPGAYQFVVYPKPAREGGSNVSNRMSVVLQIDDNPVVEFRDQSSWRSQRGDVHLDTGMHHIHVWAKVVSDGFGPSPSDSQLLLEVKGPGDASPHPLSDLRPVQR